MTQPTTAATSTADREIVMTRVFDAPRELVFQAWTDPQQVPRWWGPKGFTTTTERMDVRPGGEWRYCMHGPDGHDYQNIITFLEVVKPERLVYKHGGVPESEPVNFEVTVTFEDLGGKTRLTMRSLFPSAAAREFVIKTYGALEGGKQHLARLGEHLASMTENRNVSAAGSAVGKAGGREFVLTRVFRAPREVVFKAWTERERLMQWFGPKGFTIPAATIDLRPGGVFLYCMRSPDGKDMWGKWVFREIAAPARLVFVVSFSDEQGGTTRHPFAPDWPLETLSTVTFDEHAGIGRGTVVTVRWAPLNASESERKAFDAGHESMNQGWAGTMEQLTAYLERA